MRRVRRGSWYPGHTNFALFVIQVSATSTAAVRGFDYLRAAKLDDPQVVIPNDAPPLPVWAIVFLVGAGLIVTGMAGRWARVIAVGHMVTMAAYASAGWAAFQVTGFGPGFRLAYGLGGGAVIHGALAFSIFAVLRRREELARTVTL